MARSGVLLLAEQLRAKDVMTNELITCFPNESVVNAAKKMSEYKVGSVLVVDRANPDRIIGILTEGDIVRRVVAKGLHPAEVKVEDVMTRDPVVVDEDTPLHLVADLMREKNIGHVPVVDAAGRLKGIIAKSDIVRISPGLIERLYIMSESETEQR
ncbi:MAG TPA: CBS domain-containing protein [Pyrodictiaceae archaeon]|nr:CBS domain-containing protein [Pyrodictiaceae archaeon]HIP85969.1 CBS domain-containing protein [Pyrodictium sp.]HIQ10365.1 CBS domain-containing protein [Pyrodictium sp.]HIQ55540.1 CBS domain-containing protein [Pyrodictium sp.]